MSLDKRYEGYESFSYLEAGRDYRAFDLCDELERVTPYRLPLDDAESQCWHITGIKFSLALGYSPSQ